MGVFRKHGAIFRMCQALNDVTLRTLRAHHVNQVNCGTTMKAFAGSSSVKFAFRPSPPAVPVKFDQERRILVGWWRHYLTSPFCRQHSEQGSYSAEETSRAFPLGILWDELFRVYHIQWRTEMSNNTFISLVYVPPRIHHEINSILVSWASF